MQRSILAALSALGALAFTIVPPAPPAEADGFREERRPRMCVHHSQARYLLSLVGTDRLRPEVEDLYHRAVASSKGSIASGSPRFIWSTQTKAACAKVIGYLAYPLRRTATRESLQKCECFASRMAAYGG